MIRVLQFMESLDRGGIESFVMNVFRNIDRSEFSFSFLLLRENTYDFLPEVLAMNAKVYYLIPEGCRLSDNAVVRGMQYLEAFAIWLKKHRHEFDIVHVQASHLQNFYPYLRLLKSQKIDRVILHSHNSTNESKKITVCHKIFRKLLPGLRLKYAACSETAGRWMFGGRADFQIVRNGIELDKFYFNEEKRRQVRRKWGIKEGCTAVCHVGRFDFQKNHIFLIHAYQHYLQKNPDSALYLIGEGKNMSMVKELAKDLQIDKNVYFMGVQSNIDYILSGMDVFAFPSHFEGLSVVLIEAQANGIPIIASDTISEETRLCSDFTMLPINNTDEAYGLWADTIDLAAKKGRSSPGCSSGIAEYDIRNVVRKLEELYRDMGV